MKHSFFISFFFLLVSSCATHHISATNKPDIVIFSYDRPLQLFALLESVFKHCANYNNINVIFRASNEKYYDAYSELQELYPTVRYFKQGANPAADFKELTIRASFDDSTSEYILYAVDDIIVKAAVDLSFCAQCLEGYQAYGFFLRLGKNLSYCYSMNRSQSLPVLQLQQDDVYAWQFNNAQLDWAYPHTVDMTIFRKKDIKEDFVRMRYATPNQLEANWSKLSSKIIHKKGLCFSETKMVNLPLNRVQHDFNNRCMNYMTSEQLLEVFNEKLKMDIIPIEKIVNNSAHMDYTPTFIKRR